MSNFTKAKNFVRIQNRFYNHHGDTEFASGDEIAIDCTAWDGWSSGKRQAWLNFESSQFNTDLSNSAWLEGEFGAMLASDAIRYSSTELRELGYINYPWILLEEDVEEYADMMGEEVWDLLGFDSEVEYRISQGLHEGIEDPFTFSMALLSGMDMERKHLSREQWNELAWCVKAAEPRSWNYSQLLRVYDLRCNDDKKLVAA